MRLSPLVFYPIGVLLLLFVGSCSDVPAPETDAGYGIRYPDRPDAETIDMPGTSGDTPFIPPWEYKKWLIDPGPETTP